MAGISSLLRRIGRWLFGAPSRGYDPADLVNLERVHFFAGQLLTAEDFAQEQTYFREKQRRHNRLLHGWGVVSGLDVAKAEGCVVQIEPGHALNRNGDEIVIARAVRLDVCEQEGVKDGQTAQLAVRFAEYSPREGRTREGAEVAVLTRPPEPEWVVLAAVTVAAGEVSVDSRPRRLHSG